MIPVLGALIQFKENKKRYGAVRGSLGANSQQVKVYCFNNQKEITVNIDKLRSGFRVGMNVLHSDRRLRRASIEWGIIQAIRETAGHELLLVEFPTLNKRVWLPWQKLSYVESVSDRYKLSRFEVGKDIAERQRLRTLAWAIQLWNENTGALSTFDIDPLPHQIHLVHHILASGQFNWLIADDVGLGKTIEVGLLLAALRHRDQARRVLLITPAGLTRQWQEEMSGRFGIDDFRIYGDDFNINEARHWSMYPYVIGSIDRFKSENHTDMLLQAEHWDLVIVDEAHRLTRRQYGNKFDASQRYSLLRKLRQRTEHVLLLTATPHQGKEDSFVGLLELLRPERKNELLSLSLNPEIISEMVFRNNKADVTDLDGNFIFKGKVVRQIAVPTTLAAQDFDFKLKQYLQEGYDAESRAEGNTAKAIGFVMMVYRKLAASSIAAIHSALVCRYKRLLGEQTEINRVDAEDERYEGEQEELRLAEKESVTPFFDHEKEMLAELIELAKEIKKDDLKLQSFLDQIVEQVLAQNKNEKLLIFTEYRKTLKWIYDALTLRFGENSVGTIHGGMSVKERRSVISDFDKEDGIQFIVSTEAGGEGINLQKHCHIMVNYDLPWNPMRLVQRVGRLYRYGQEKTVVVFNLRQEDSADDRILSILYERLEQVAKDMAPVQHEQEEAMKEDILGGLSSLIDIESILLESSTSTISRTQERINEAIDIARNAARKQNDIFQFASGFNPNEVGDEISISQDHLKSFVEGMAALLDIEILEETHKGLVWQLRLPEELKDELGVSRARWGVTFDRFIAAQREDLLPINLDSWFFKYLIKEATSYSFGGVTALTSQPESEAVLAAVARWQNDKGKRMRQELAVVAVDGDRAETNPSWLSDWLLRKQPSVSGDAPLKESAVQAWNAANFAVEELLSKRCSNALLPEEPQWVSGNWNA